MKKIVAAALLIVCMTTWAWSQNRGAQVDRVQTASTVLSQIMGMAVGRHWAYYIISLTITVVLALAANTSFGGLPILASLLARDHYLPHLFSLRGDRQVFGNGIWVAANCAAI